MNLPLHALSFECHLGHPLKVTERLLGKCGFIGWTFGWTIGWIIGW